MKTKAGKKVLKDITKDKKELLKDLKELAQEFKAYKDSGSQQDSYLYTQLLGRAKSYKEQLEKAQGYVDVAIFIESFLE